jgi:hypothetical protein
MRGDFAEQAWTGQARQNGVLIHSAAKVFTPGPVRTWAAFGPIPRRI